MLFIKKDTQTNAYTLEDVNLYSHFIYENKVRRRKASGSNKKEGPF